MANMRNINRIPKPQVYNSNQLEFKRKRVVRIEHFRDNLFLVQFERYEPIVCDDKSLVINSSNYDDFKQPLLQFLRGKKLQKINSEDNDFNYDSGEVIYIYQEDDCFEYDKLEYESLLNSLRRDI